MTTNNGIPVATFLAKPTAIKNLASLTYEKPKPHLHIFYQPLTPLTERDLDSPGPSTVHGSPLITFSPTLVLGNY